MSNVIIAVGPTGGFATKADSPYLPTTPEDIAAEATAAYAAGAAVVSVHLRDEQQRPTADPDIAGRTMDLIGEQSPILVQLSTGVSPDAPFEDRAELLELRPRTAENLLHTVRALPGDSVWQAIAIGRANFDFAVIAIALGGNARTGLEDNLYLRRGELTPGNAPLVTRAVNICRALDRDVATPVDAERILGLSPAAVHG